MDVFRKRRKVHVDRITLHGAQVVTRMEKVHTHQSSLHNRDILKILYTGPDEHGTLGKAGLQSRRGAVMRCMQW